jgi:hypothetical protein
MGVCVFQIVFTKKAMENKIRILEPLHPYLLQFSYAQLNFKKFLEEENNIKHKSRKRAYATRSKL